MSISIKVIGLQKSQKFLKALNIKKLVDLNSAVHKEGFLLLSEVQNSIAGRKSEPTSVDTGNFLNSINRDSNMNTPLISIVQSKVPYAEPLENGTTRMRGRKHFKNSRDRRQPEIILAIKKAIT